MTQSIFAVILLAALIDALQHCAIKSGPDAFGRALVVAMLGGLVAAPVLLATGLPDRASWPWLAVSTLLGCLYWVSIGWAYDRGALAVVFPISRGTAVLLTTLGAGLLMDQSVTVLQAGTVAMVLGGLCLVAMNANLGKRPSLRSVVPSLVVALVISGFTLIDANGVRVAGSAMSYCAAVYLGNSVGIAIYVLIRQRARVRQLGTAVVLPGLATSILSISSYTLLLFAMRHAPVAAVAALIETSIVFAAVLGWLWLREPLRLGHSIGVSFVALGAVFLQFAQ